MKSGIAGEPPGRKHIRVAIVILVPDQPGVMLGDARGHKLANHTTEIGWHEKRLKPWKDPGMELCINEAQEIDEFFHGKLYVVCAATVRHDNMGIETVRIDRMRKASSRFELVRSHSGPHRSVSQDDDGRGIIKLNEVSATVPEERRKYQENRLP